MDRDALARDGSEPDVIERRFNRAHDAASGRRRRISRTADGLGDARDEARGGEDGRHVGGRRSDVFRRHVGAAERRDEAPVVLVQGLSVNRVAVALVGDAGDDALAAAPPQAGECVLASHAARKPKPVAHGIAHRCVLPVPHATRALAAHRSVKGRAEERPGCGTHLEEDAVVRGEIGQRLHGSREAVERCERRRQAFRRRSEHQMGAASPLAPEERDEIVGRHFERQGRLFRFERAHAALRRDQTGRKPRR